MSTIEAAASLFGSSDSGSDFFTAPESSSSAAESPITEHHPNGQFIGQDSSELFGPVDSAKDGTAPFLAQDEQYGVAAESTDIAHSQPAVADPYPPPESHMQSNAYSEEVTTGGYDNAGLADYNASGWYDEQGHWHAYEQMSTEAYFTSGTTSNFGNDVASAALYTGYTESQTTTFYDSQAAQRSTYSYEPATFNSGQHQAVEHKAPQSLYSPYSEGEQSSIPSTTPYDPYRPTSSMASNVASSTTSAAVASSYEPYKPPLAQAHTATYVTTNSIPPTWSNPGTAVQEAKPVAPPYRPSTANAYDPPLPTAKSKRSFSVHPAPYNLSGSSTYATPSTPPPRAIRSEAHISRASPPISPGPPRSLSRSTFHSQQKQYGHAEPPAHAMYSETDTSQALHQSSTSPTKQKNSHQSLQNMRYGSPSPIPESVYHPRASPSPTNRFTVTSSHSHAPPTSSVQVQPSTSDNRWVYGQDSHVSNPDIVQPPKSVSPELGSGVASSYNGGPVSPITHVEQPSNSPYTKQLTSGSARRGSSSSLRSNSPSSRMSAINTGTIYESIDERMSSQSSLFDSEPRNSLEWTGPSNGLSNNFISESTSPTVHVEQSQNVVDLGSDTSSVHGRSLTPPLYVPQSQETISPIQTSSDSADKSISLDYDSYRPRHSFSSQRTMSPVHTTDSYSTYSTNPSRQNSYDPPIARERSSSNFSSSVSLSSNSVYDPYAPAHPPREPLPPVVNNYSLASGPALHDTSQQMDSFNQVPTELSFQPMPISGPYAPSPSLLGTNDPLGRASANVPVISFGFGGKLVTCFRTPSSLETGFDVALSRKRTDVHIRSLHTTIPEAALDGFADEYPGPLFGDPGTPVTALVRTTTSSNTKIKSKKNKVLNYLTKRADEIQRGLGYLHEGSLEKRKADGKLTLVRLLHVLVEHDGQLSGSPAAEDAVRAALMPRLAETSDAMLLNVPTAADIVSGSFGLGIGHDPPIAEYAVRPSALNTLQNFLLRGEKRKAYHYALDEKLWAHAMVISSSIDKEAFKEVVNEFIRTELEGKDASKTAQVDGKGKRQLQPASGHECLRLAYGLYSGQSSAAVSYLLPSKLYVQNGPALTLQPPTPLNLVTPLSPNFPPPALTAGLPVEMLSRWHEYAAILFSGQMGTESSSALTTLGDYLISNDWIEAAHCCYLLSPQSSPIGGIGSPSTRITLIGSHNPQRNHVFFKDPDCLIFTEIVEFALSLRTVNKAQEPFPGFPHLQAYRLIRAYQLAEMGYIAQAKRYCEAITSVSTRTTPFLSGALAEQLKELSSQLTGDPELDKAKAWIGSKIAKPSLDSFGDWLGGTLSKFVAGEAETSSPITGESPMLNNPAYTGAFSRYSNISSTNSSKSPSPAPSFVNTATLTGSVPGRSEPLVNMKPLVNTYSPVNRSSSAMDHNRPNSRMSTPPPRVASADAATLSFAQSQSFSQAMEKYSYNGDDSRDWTGNGATEKSSADTQETGWWSAAYGGSNGATPTATTFYSVDTAAATSDSGFISLMDNHNAPVPSPYNTSTFNGKVIAEEDGLEDDLGLGNRSSRKEKPGVDDNHTSSSESHEAEKEEEVKEVKKPDAKPTSSGSGSWLGRWFSRSASATPGPVRANLGEETSFYYDKDLKRWVNKKVGAESAKPAAPPPPPSRAQTVSPSKTTSHTIRTPPSPLPPHRPASTAGAGLGPPQRSLQRAQSNLAIGESGFTSTPPVLASLSAPPPAGRSKSAAAARRNVRSRYVDVLQPQENS